MYMSDECECFLRRLKDVNDPEWLSIKNQLLENDIGVTYSVLDDCYDSEEACIEACAFSDEIFVSVIADKKSLETSSLILVEHNLGAKTSRKFRVAVPALCDSVAMITYRDRRDFPDKEFDDFAGALDENGVFNGF